MILADLLVGKKISIIIYRDSELAGGSVRVAEIIASTLPALGFDVYALVAYGGEGRVGRILGGRCLYVNSSGPRDVFGWFRFVRMFCRVGPDVIHFVDGVGWMILLSAFSRARKLFHQHFRPDVGPDGLRRIPRIQLLSKFCHGIISISFGAARCLKLKCKIPASKIHVVHNSVSSGYLSFSLLPSLQQEGGVRVLGMAIRVVEDKGVEDAIRLISLLPDRFILKIAGDGPARARFEELCSRMGVANRVVWLGSVRNISDFYREIDYYFYASWYEGFGLSVAEAMWSGRPVVGFSGDGEIFEPEFPLLTHENSLMVRRSRPGIFAPEEDDAVILELCDRLLELDASPSRRASLAALGRNWVLERFSGDRFGRAIADVYLDVCK